MPQKTDTHYENTQVANIGSPKTERKEEHKDHFLDFRTYLLTNGLKDANITATEQDQKDLTNSYIPSSLLKEDKFAGNDTFNQLLANQIYQKLQELQYIK